MTIIGSGDVASAIPDRVGLCFFASGVSNSQETRESEYQREKDLLSDQSKNLHLVYFSSLGVLNGKTRYYEHKREMEEIVKTFRLYTIVRLGNITWGDNPTTFINYLKNKIKTGQPYEIKDEYRYIVDKDEFQYWLNLIPGWTCELSIVGRRMKVSEVVKEYIL